MDLSRAHALVKTSLVGELLVEAMSPLFFTRLAEVQGDRATMPAQVMDLYRRPLQDSGNAKATLALMRMLADGPDQASSPALRDIERYVAGLDIPAELVWGINGPFWPEACPSCRKCFQLHLLSRPRRAIFCRKRCPRPSRQRFYGLLKGCRKTKQSPCKCRLVALHTGRKYLCAA